MKRKHKISGTLLAAGMLTAALAMTVSAAPITEQSAKSIALTTAGITEDSVLYIAAKLDHDDGKQIYEVDLLTNDYREYDFDIYAESGAVLSVSYEWKAAPVNGTAAPATVTLEQAKTFAAAHAGLTADTVTFKKAETDLDDGRAIHEIEFFTADRKEYEYEIDAATGAVLKWEYDLKHYTPQTQTQKPASDASQSKPAAAVSGIESAKATALKMAGLNDPDVRWGKVKQDYEDGRLIYEGEFYCNNMEYEFEIDAATGAIIDWDVDEDD